MSVQRGLCHPRRCGTRTGGRAGIVDGGAVGRPPHRDAPPDHANGSELETGAEDWLDAAGVWQRQGREEQGTFI